MADISNKNKGEKTALDLWLEKSKSKTVSKGLESIPEGEKGVLSYGQERLWLLEQIYSGQNLYNYARHYRIKGALNVAHLVESFKILVQRHEVLRTNYKSEGNKTVQFINHENIPLEVIDASEMSKDELADKIKTLSRVSLDLSKDALFRSYLFDLGNDQYEMLLVIHHIIGDAWSIGIINREISSNYQALISGNAVTSTRLKYQYDDFAFWQKKQEIKTADIDYWKQKLIGEIPKIQIPFNRAKTSFKGKSYNRNLSKNLTNRLKEFSKANNTTMYTLLLAAYKIFLSKYCNETDIIVGSPFSNRDEKELEKIIGFFNETILIRSELQDQYSFLDYIKVVGGNVREAMAHKNVPFDRLVNEINPVREHGENPLFQTMFLYNEPSDPLNLGDEFHIHEYMMDIGVSKFDLTLFVNDQLDNLQLSFEYNEALDDRMVESMSIHFEELLINLTEKPQENITQISLLPKVEFDKITKDWNDTFKKVSQETVIHEIIKDQVQKNPDAIAVVFNEQELSYKELDGWSAAVAMQLLDKGLRKNQFIGLYTHRSLEMIVGILAILKAGCAYLPLDPDYPQERIQYMLADTKTDVILAQEGLVTQVETENNSVIPIVMDNNATKDISSYDIKISPQDFAYIIYTSGSTGKPKGVAVTHANLIHSTTARFDFYREPINSFLLLSSFSFDSSIVGIFWPLCTGAKIVLPPKRIEQDVDQLSTIILNHKVTHTLLLPSLYQVMLSYVRPEKLKYLKAVIVAGEACVAQMVEKHFSALPSVDLYNEYGPTEASVWCIATKITANKERKSIPIGRPITNTSAFIFDKYNNPVPVGVPGELHIGGLGITNGYHNRPSLTSEKFIPHNIIGENNRLYKTGDIAKYNDDGSINYIGRIDRQIKIRGNRVELEEIKTIILQDESVIDAIVDIQSKDKIDKIIAWIQSASIDLEPRLKEKLKKVLPNYMMPSVFVVLNSFPKLPNGKIDVKNLKIPELISSGVEYVAPSDENEIKLVEIWQEVLKIKQIGVTDNFFDIGGDSILSIQIVAKAQQQNIDISPTALIGNPTIQQLAKLIRQDDYGQDWSSIVPMKTTGEKPPLFCIHSGGAHVMFYQGVAKYIGDDRPVYAIQPVGIDGNENYHDSISSMAADYIQEMKKVQPLGPYFLMGTCFGNAVGIEMSHQLKALGDEVEVLYVVDSAPAFIEPPSPNGERKPVRRMLNLLKKGDIQGIYKKFKHRYIRLNRKLTESQRNQKESELYEMIDSLNGIYVSYSWKPVDHKIVLIRSSEFSAKENKKFHLERWSYLSKDQLEVYEAEGHHLTLFKEPEVQDLMSVVTSHLNKINTI